MGTLHNHIPTMSFEPIMKMNVGMDAESGRFAAMTNPDPQEIVEPSDPKSDPLTSYLNYYKKLEQPGYAVLVTGDWGVGKTYQVKKALEADDAVYVSLFGLQTADDAYMAVLSQADSGAANRVRLKNFAKDKNLGFNTPYGGVTLPLGGILTLGISDNVRRKISDAKIIVFDDLERSLIKLKSLLGVINFYVEHCGCRVFVVTHDDKITAEFDEAKEKIFGQTIRVLPKTDEAFDYFVSTFEETEITQLRKQSPIIKKIFIQSQCKSLRVMKQLLQDTLRFCDLFEVKQIQNKAKFETLLELFLAIDIEVRSDNLKREDISSRETAHLLAIAAKMDKGSTTPDLKETVIANRFLISRSKFESVLDLNSLDLTDDILIQTTVDGQYDKIALQFLFASSHYFDSPSEQPAWLRFINFDTNPDDIVEVAAQEMDKKFSGREVHDLGEFLHIVALRFMRSENKLIADDYDKIVKDSKSYLDDLVSQKKFPIDDPQHRGGYRSGYGGHGYWGYDGSPYEEKFFEVRHHISICRREAIEIKLPEFREELLELLKNDPESFIAVLGMSDNGTGKYYNLPVLDGIGAKEFVEQYLAVPFEYWRALRYFLNERMQRCQSEPTMKREQKWFVDLVAEMNGRVAALGNTIGAIRLKRHIPEGK